MVALTVELQTSTVDCKMNNPVIHIAKYSFDEAIFSSLFIKMGTELFSGSMSSTQGVAENWLITTLQYLKKKYSRHIENCATVYIQLKQH